MPVKWDDKLDIKFLCTIMKAVEAQVSRENWDIIAKRMGSEFTLEACRLHYAKVHERVATENGASEASNESTATTITPACSPTRRKRKTKGESVLEKPPKKTKNIPHTVFKNGKNGESTTSPLKHSDSASAE